LNDEADNAALEDALKIATSKHDLVGVEIYDRREAELPAVGMIELRDAESGETVWVDTSSRRVREHYARRWAEQQHAVETLLKGNKVDAVRISTDSDYVKELIKLFKQR
jgi:uncharacterized protein (DUF58 family)